MTDVAEPLRPDTLRWLERTGVDRSSWEGDDLAAVLNRVLLNQVVAAELDGIRHVLGDA